MIIMSLASLYLGSVLKTLRICNIQEIDKFRSKLTSAGLGQHSSLLRSPYITNPLCYVIFVSMLYKTFYEKKRFYNIETWQRGVRWRFAKRVELLRGLLVGSCAQKLKKLFLRKKYLFRYHKLGSVL